jgi:hypothetical protein
MPDFLFPDFLHDPVEYAAAEAYWLQQWKDLMRLLDEQQLWETPWLGTTFADGTPCRDGNPIFSAVSYSHALAVRIIQVQPAGNPREFSVWTDNFDEGDDVLSELVISCVLTDETATYAKDMLNQWITTRSVEILYEQEWGISTDQSRNEVLLGAKVTSALGRSPGYSRSY